MNRVLTAALGASILLSAPAMAQPKDTGEAAFRELYKELVETDTTGSAGDCTLASQRLATRLTAAGLPTGDVRVMVPDGKPQDGNLFAVFPGRDLKAKAVLLMGHIDVVEAKREDWERDPFKLVEEDGYFYARGAFDDKAQSAIFADLLTRFHKEGYRPRRTVKLMLTCGEEGGGRVNGARWFTQNHRQLIDAGLALNEGGGGALDASGKRVSHGILVAEKAPVSFIFEVTNPGGHSSRPVPDNAIYHLARALDRMSAHKFPVQFNDANRGYFSRMSKILGGETGAAMAAIVANPGDQAADALLSRDPNYHAFLRTTCVATMLEAGHAGNALPQRARATVSCRVLPGVPAEEIRRTLIQVIGNPAVKVSEPRVGFPPAKAPSLTPAVLEPVEKITEAMWPGVPVVPTMEAGATDSTFLNAAGIPAYGISGLFVDPDIGRIHGLNERIRVKSVMEGREFLYRLVKAYADQRD